MAKKFQVTSLVDICYRQIHQVKISPSNVFDALQIATSLQNGSMIDKCLKLIKESTKEVINANESLEMTSTMVHTILDSNELMENEFELVRWVCAWARRWSPESSDSRQILEQFLPKMNFLSLSNIEFTKLLMEMKVMFSDEEIVSIYMNISIPGSVPVPDWYNFGQGTARAFLA